MLVLTRVFATDSMKSKTKESKGAHRKEFSEEEVERSYSRGCV